MSTTHDHEAHDDHATEGSALQERVEEAALASHDDASAAGAAGHPADGATDTQGRPARGTDVTPEGDVTERLGGPMSGEDGYVAVDPAGVSGDRTAGLTAEDEDGRGESGAEPGAQVTGSGGR
ncbi:hypothetical protein ES689_00835 [Frigoribacterium sp. ACAM 257]|uniref:hypothetical protein n=1 Tax=Frigoribacterium sp. ACAM 257 TaxID=2508998 RepID=UPI0011BA02AB|nr:hypothetical protein [Frigoribacterium sp. ACAM 257]TWX40071.1 hypothetical protein ES689_00835 [Frigoribacterium sp. ACAM 257]